MLVEKQLRETDELKAKAQVSHAQPDDLIDFYHLKSRKFAVNTIIQDEKEFLDHITKSTNMKCLAPPSALEGYCGFLAANLFAKSVFGEDALVNLGVEKQEDGKLSGLSELGAKPKG